MACPDLEDETTILAALAKVTKAEVDEEGILHLTGPEGQDLGFQWQSTPE